MPTSRTLLKRRGLEEPLEKVCRAYNVTLDDVLSGRRFQRLVRARDACIHKLSTIGLSLHEIAAVLGMDHSSAHEAKKRYLERDNGKLQT